MYNTPQHLPKLFTTLNNFYTTTQKVVQIVPICQQQLYKAFAKQRLQTETVQT